MSKINFDLTKIKYIDTHSHIHDKAFDDDRDAVIKKMNESGIATITIGTDLLESSKAKNLSLANENIFYTAGLHPHDNLEEFHSLFLENHEAVFPDYENIKEYFDKLKVLAESEKCFAIGECGLDYFYFDKEKSAHTFEQMK
jgi:TatD DNase family protein